MNTAMKGTVRRLLRRYGYELRHVGSPSPREPMPEALVAYVDEAKAIEARHARQTAAVVERLRRQYAAPVLGDVRVWELVEMLASCVDPSDQALFGTSQQVHVRQVLEGMERDGIDDPDLLLAALVHDVGKVLLLVGEDPANVVCMNTPIGRHEPGIGLDHCTIQWSHDEFAYTRLRDHVPEHVAWLVRYHSIDPVVCAPLMDATDRERTQRYLDVFRRYDHGTKSPYHLPRRRIDEYRDLVEEAFPKPIPF